MPTLADLKAQHPEWCWECECLNDALHCPKLHDNRFSHFCALIAKALEDEARINMLTEAMADYDVVAREDHERSERLVAILKQDITAEREAHEVTKKALEEVDDALMECYVVACCQGGGYRISDGSERSTLEAESRYEARKKEVKG